MTKGWTKTTLGEAATFTSKPRNLDIKSHDRVPFVPMASVPQGSTYINDWTWKSGEEIRSGTYFEKGDCLLAKITPCFENGKQAVANDLPMDFGYGSTELIPFRGRDGVSDKYFLFFYLLETTVRQEIANKMEGATGRQRIPISMLNKWPISLPPLPEQKKIAAILLKIQRAIETQDKIIQSLRDLKKSTLQHVFTKGLRGEKTKMTEIGEMPESWEAVPLSDVCEFLQYGTSKRCSLTPKGSAVLRIPNVIGGRIDTAELKYAETSTTEHERFAMEVGDILFVRTNGQKQFVGRTAVFKGSPDNAMFASYLIRARLKAMINPDFIQLFTETHQGKKQLGGSAAPASDGKFNINTKTINSMLVPLPVDMSEQNDVVSHISQINSHIDTHQIKKSTLQNLFKTTLNRLMTGNARVMDLDIDLKAVDA